MSTPLGPATGTYAPPTDLRLSCPACGRAPGWLTNPCQDGWHQRHLARPTPEAMTWADLLARDDELREGIAGAERAGDLERARCLFLERLRVGREISARRAVALAAAVVPADDRTPERDVGGVGQGTPVESTANAGNQVRKE